MSATNPKVELWKVHKRNFYLPGPPLNLAASHPPGGIGMPIWRAPPIEDTLLETLREPDNAGCFLMCFWLATSVSRPVSNPDFSKAVHRIIAGGEYHLIANGAVICETAIADQWQAAVDAVAACFDGDAPLNYPQLLERAGLRETSLRCVLASCAIRLAAQYGKPDDWATMVFKRVLPDTAAGELAVA